MAHQGPLDLLEREEHLEVPDPEDSKVCLDLQVRMVCLVKMERLVSRVHLV
jgi:hypothetical protein